MIDIIHLVVRALKIRSFVIGFTPPFARVAASIERSCVEVSREHNWKYNSSVCYILVLGSRAPSALRK